MNNNEWKELISKEFGVSKSVANKMLHAMYSVKRFRTNTNSKRIEVKPHKLNKIYYDQFANEPTTKKLKVTQCQGEGQGSCKRCNDKGKWNRAWMFFLYKIEGYEGCYCRNCVKEIQEEQQDD